MSAPAWEGDLLPGYQSVDLPLSDPVRAAGEPEDVELVGTLVRRVPAGGSSGRAVLYLHGWNDYFFQTHVADFLAERGFDFFAVDLRRYGRSLRRGHLRGFITDLDHYAAELDAAIEIIRADHDDVLLLGHSTGGLIAALYAAGHPEHISGLALNSPWLDMQGSAMVRALGAPVVDALGSRSPGSVIRLPDLGLYARSVHTSFGGEWDYDLELKSSPGPPIRVGWLRAILLGQQRVAAGLSLTMPVLVLASARTEFARRWHEGLRSVDTVLDVDQIVARAVRLGRHVTVVRIESGLHDLFLSAATTRMMALEELGRWAEAYVLEPGRPASPAGSGLSSPRASLLR